MLVLLSPAKTQDFETKPPVATASQPALLEQATLLIKELRRLGEIDVSAIMGVSSKIADLNRKRYKAFKTPFTPDNAKQAAFAFKGDVYSGFMAEDMDAPTLKFAQTHIRILSGLYGVLRPLDLIQAYRLEMKIRLSNPRGKDLYQFWGDLITEELNKTLAENNDSVVVNLASQEYFKAVDPAKLNANIITPHFKEKKNGNYLMIALFAKRARGAMARYIAQQRVTDPEALNFFAEDGYRLNLKLSEKNNPVFTRG